MPSQRYFCLDVVVLKLLGKKYFESEGVSGHELIFGLLQKSDKHGLVRVVIVCLSVTLQPLSFQQEPRNPVVATRQEANVTPSGLFR